MLQYTFNESTVKEFYYDGEDLVLPAYTELAFDGKVWALYTNEIIDWSFLVTRGILDGQKGWRVMVVSGIADISYMTDYVMHKCGECLGLR